MKATIMTWGVTPHSYYWTINLAGNVRMCRNYPRLRTRKGSEANARRWLKKYMPNVEIEEE